MGVALFSLLLASGCSSPSKEISGTNVVDVVSATTPSPLQSQARVESQVLSIYQNYLYGTDANRERCEREVMSEFRAVMSGTEGLEVLRNPELKCLDQYSYFLTPEQVRMQEAAQEGFGGIGVLLNVAEQGVVITGLDEDGSAQNADLRVGDILVGFKNEGEVLFRPLTGLTISQIIQLIRGTPDSKLYLSVKRGNTLIHTEAIPRVLLNTKTVLKQRLPNGFGYVRVLRFDERTVPEFLTAMYSFSNKKREACVVVDVRDNPGGLLNAVEHMLYTLSSRLNDRMYTTRFLSGDLGHVTIRDLWRRMDAYATTPEEHQALLPGDFEKYKIVFLVNGRSASASEIFTGTAKDWGARTGNFSVVGSTTYGKGVGQGIFSLLNGGDFHLTYFEYYVGNSDTPVNGIGVIPNHMVRDTRQPLKDSLSANDAQFQEGQKVLRALCPTSVVR